MSGVPLAHDAGELPYVGRFETLVLGTVRRATIAALASAVAITACSAAGVAASSTSGETGSVVGTTSAMDESSQPAAEGDASPPATEPGMLMMEGVEKCAPGKILVAMEVHELRL
jgi:phosphate/sulfate permease